MAEIPIILSITLEIWIALDKKQTNERQSERQRSNGNLFDLTKWDLLFVASQNCNFAGATGAAAAVEVSTIAKRKNERMNQ